MLMKLLLKSNIVSKVDHDCDAASQIRKEMVLFDKILKTGKKGKRERGRELPRTNVIGKRVAIVNESPSPKHIVNAINYNLISQP